MKLKGFIDYKEKYLKKLFNEELGVYIGIPSKSRAFRVKQQEELMGLKPTWFVPEDEVKQYEDEGAIVIPCKVGLSVQRNTILEESFKNNQTCLMLDDDLIEFSFIYDDKTSNTISFNEAVNILKREINIFKLAGNSSGTNLFWYDPNRPKSIKSPVAGMILVKPSTPRYDEELILNEDTDFCLQHKVKYGGLIKVNYVINKFHGTDINYEKNTFKKTIEGGLKYKLEDLEKSFNYLQNKWGDLVKPSKSNKYDIGFR